MSRKYRQRGYQDDDRPERDRASGRPRTKGDAPRGRGVGAPGTVVLRCRSCGTRVEELIEPDSQCPSCGTDLHTCTHCRYYDTAAIDECTVEEAPPVARKAKANECQYFRPRKVVESRGTQKKAGDAKSEFDSLFDF